MPLRRLRLLALITCTLAACGKAGTHPLGVAERRAAIAQLAMQVQSRYLDAGLGARAATLLRARARDGAYDAIDDDAALAQRLSADLWQAAHDSGLRVRLAAPAPLPWRDDAGIASYSKVTADIGYLDITAFVTPQRCAARYAKAFGKLGATRTIIVDLRHNDGGDADGLQLLASYVVDRPIHYADLRHRTGVVDARWAYPQLAARPYLDQLTILIGPQTSAEAENFAFAMQAWKRATVVGSRSAGVTTASLHAPLAGRLVADVPAARVTLPLTGASWHGGVTPDVTVAGDALREAQRGILNDRLLHVTTPMGRGALLALIHAL